MGSAAHATECRPTTVFLHMPEGLAVEAPWGLGGVTPHGVNTPRAKVEGLGETAPDGHLDLACRHSAAMTRVVRAPPHEGDARVRLDGVKREGRWVSDKDTLGRPLEPLECAAERCLSGQPGQEEGRLLVPWREDKTSVLTPSNPELEGRVGGGQALDGLVSRRLTVGGEPVLAVRWRGG